MEELFFQQNQLAKYPRQANANGLGQSWEDINQGMKNTLFMHNTNHKGNGRIPQLMLKNHSRIELNKSQSFKQFHGRQPFKFKSNDPLTRINPLKICRSITQSSYLKSYRKQQTDEESKENYISHLQMPNKMNRAGFNERQGDIINDFIQRQQGENGRITNNLSFKNSERYNYSQGKHINPLNVIKEESNKPICRLKMKSQAVKIKSFDIYPIDHSAAFVSRYINKDSLSITKPATYHSEYKHENAIKYDRLPIIRIENNFQSTKKSSLSIHASNYKQKIFLLHRLSKNSSKFQLKGEKSKERASSKQENGMGIKKFKLVLNPRLSKLKLFN